MIVSSVFCWLQQIRYKAEAYECSTLEQRRLWRAAETPLPEETRWSCPLGFEGDWTREVSQRPDSPDPPDNGAEAESDAVQRVQCLEVLEMNEAKLSPVMRTKGQSLDSLLIGEVTERVEMRQKRHTLGGGVPDMVERRKGAFFGLETIDEDLKHGYENIWECGSLPLKIQHGDISRTSVIFDETVEELETGQNVPIKYFADIPDDMVLWLTDLLDTYCPEEDYEMESYTALPIRDYVAEIRNVQPQARMTMDFIPSAKIAEAKTFEKCTKVSVDGKSIKIGKNDTLKLDNNKLFISDEKGCNKVIVPEFNKYKEHASKSPKELLYVCNKSVVKIHRESELVEMKTMLQKLLGRRTQYSLLESKGIAKNEPVFGNTLDNIGAREKRDVPEFVAKITRLLEAPKNIASSGLYRASGNIATIQKIRCKVDLNKLGILDEYKDDADVLAGTLKMFFRELKESAVGLEEYNALSEILLLGGRISGHKRKGLMKKFAEKVPPHADTFLATVEVIQRLSRPRRETIEHLMRHLLRVTSFEEENSMNLQNMSICWGPSLINFDSGTNRDEVYAAMQKKNSIVELMLRSYKFYESQQRPTGSRLSLANERPSLQRLDSAEGTMSKWSSMSALDRKKDINHTFVRSLMRKIETHKDAKDAYNRTDGEKMASKILSKLKQEHSKTLTRLLEKARIEELCTLLKYCYEDQIISFIHPTDFSQLEKERDRLTRVYQDPIKVSPDMYNIIRPLAKKEKLFEEFLHLFAHLHTIITFSDDQVGKLQKISVFWYKAICGHEPNGNRLPIMFDIIEAFKETDWINAEERKTSTAEITLRPSKSSSGGLSLITEETAKAFKGDESSVDCCIMKRPETCVYTKAD